MYKLTVTLFVVLIGASCGSSGKKSSVDEIKSRLEKAQAEQAKANEEVRLLEEQLSKVDSSYGKKQNAKLVVIHPVSTKPFAHYIELQGKVETENMAYVTPRGMGGQVKAIYVKQGDYVKKGQLLLKLDNAVAEQQLQQAKIQLNLAEDLYSRRQNLWDKQIGTEVELIQAKSNVENLKKSLALAQEQSDMSNVYAQISGVADMVNIKIGETFSSATASQLGIRIVNTSNLKLTAQVPEVYLPYVNVGSVVEVSLPDINKNITAKINVKGSVIDPSSRSFYVEAKIPPSNDFRPNQLALIKIQDYTVPKAITIPMNTLQNDENGKYVMVVAKEGGDLVARKRQIEVGQLYGNDLEVKSGLQENDSLITEGFQGLYDGQLVVTGENS